MLVLLLASVVLEFIRRSAPGEGSWSSSLSIIPFFDSWVNYNIIRCSASKAPVNCAATLDALKEPHSYVFQSEMLLLGSDEVTASLPQHS